MRGAAKHYINQHLVGYLGKKLTPEDLTWENIAKKVTKKDSKSMKRKSALRIDTSNKYYKYGSGPLSTGSAKTRTGSSYLRTPTQRRSAKSTWRSSRSSRKSDRSLGSRGSLVSLGRIKKHIKPLIRFKKSRIVAKRVSKRFKKQEMFLKLLMEIIQDIFAFTAFEKMEGRFGMPFLIRKMLLYNL